MEERKGIVFDLQLFSDSGDNPGADAGQDNQGAGTSTAENKEGQQERTYTQEEVDAIKKDLLTQEQVNEIVKTRLAKEKAKAEEDKKEAERLSKLSAEERAKEEAKKKDEEIAKLRAEIDRNNLEKDTVDRLNQEGLPLEFKSFLMQENAEKTNESIKAFKEVYNKAVQAEVEKRFKGKTPKGSSDAGKADVWTKLSEKYKR